MYTSKLRVTTGWQAAVSSQEAVRAVLNGFDGTEGLGSADLQSNSRIK